MKQEIKERIEKIRKGEVPEGYKETEAEIIPDDWRIQPILSLSMNGIKNGIFNNPKKVGSGIKLINVVNLYDTPHINTNNLGLLDVSKKDGELYKVQRGDLFFTRSSLKVEGIAHCNIYLEDDPIVFECHIMKISPDIEKVIPLYLKEYCKSNFARTYFMKRAKTTTMTTIGQKDIENLPVILPTLVEQKNIVELSNTWDKAIELKEKQISHSNEYKKGFMQKLLFKRVTSNILWNETQLRKCLIPTSYPVNKPSEPYYALGIRSHCKGTLGRHIEDPEKIAMDTLYEVKENELIVNITFAWEGAITLLSKKDEGKVVSHRFPTYKFNKEYAIPDYFKHLIKTKWFVFQLGLLSPGGAGRNRVLNKTDFLKLKVLLPSVEEQRKIADFLNSLDNEIDLLNKELNQLKEQKRGLMQLLLTGIVRVEVN